MTYWPRLSGAHLCDVHFILIGTALTGALMQKNSLVALLHLPVPLGLLTYTRALYELIFLQPHLKCLLGVIELKLLKRQPWGLLMGFRVVNFQARVFFLQHNRAGSASGQMEHGHARHGIEHPCWERHTLSWI